MSQFIFDPYGNPVVVEQVGGKFYLAINPDLNTQINFINNTATTGLYAAQNSLGYRIAEIERHLHSGARWFEAAGTPSTTHKADRIGKIRMKLN